MIQNLSFEEKYLLIKKELHEFDEIQKTSIMRRYYIGYFLADLVIQRLLAENLIEPLTKSFKVIK